MKAKLNPDKKEAGYRFSVLAIDPAVPQKGGFIKIEEWHLLQSGHSVVISADKFKKINERLGEFLIEAEDEPKKPPFDPEKELPAEAEEEEEAAAEE